MLTPRIRIATLDQPTLDRIQVLEEEFGHSIVAMEPYYPPATLSEDQLRRLKALEQELGVVLLAYPKE